ncbi:MAG: hypothetical protein AAGA48_19920 [Myxococcota bacterium]
MVTSSSSHPTPKLLKNRNRTVAKSFFRQLKEQGFSHEQIIELSASLLDMVNEEMREQCKEASS